LPVNVRKYIRSLAALKPGELLPRARGVKGQGVVLAWLDSIGPAKTAEWADVRDRVTDDYRRGIAARSLDSKRAELDSLLAAGWSADSVAALWGGFERANDVRPG